MWRNLQRHEAIRSLHARQREVVAVMDRAEERAGREDVGDQALMRGLDTALPFVRPGLSLSEIGRRSCDRPRSKLGSSPCRGPALSAARLMSCWNAGDVESVLGRDEIEEESKHQ